MAYRWVSERLPNLAQRVRANLHFCYRARRVLNSGPVDLESLELAYPPRTTPEFVLKNGWCPPPESKPDLPFQVRASSGCRELGPFSRECCRFVWVFPWLQQNVAGTGGSGGKERYSGRPARKKIIH